MKPIIDLHLHLDGSLPLNAVDLLLSIYPGAVPEAFKPLLDLGEEERKARLMQELQAPATCNSLQEYLQRFDLPVSLLQTPFAMSLAVGSLLNELKEEGVRYAEIRFAPQLHSPAWSEKARLMREREIMEAMLETASRVSGIKANFILCCMRNLPDRHKLGYDPNRNTLRLAEEFLGSGVVAVDLAGAEARDATSEFRKLFEMAKEMKLPFTIHAGEAGSRDWRMESLRSAIEFGAKRIGHGIALEHSPELRAICKERGIGIECCPVSNLQTKGVCGGIKNHPLPMFLEEGLLVSVNTDNRTVSNTTLQKEFEVLSEVGIGEAEQKQLTLNAIESSFADDATKEWLKKMLI
ncbi:MAG: adenosine deaminase family protein [Clostridia bacterium]|nr:adenosine deaminase family protein [Clostridia bacterium]